MLNRRSVIKTLHWVSLALMVYFYLVEPENVRNLGAVALATHSGVGVLLAIVSTVWLMMFLRKGLASRPGPKLPGWAKKLHPIMHRVLYYGVPLMVFTGALAAFAAPYVVMAFGVLPLNPGFGTKATHDLLSEVHEIAFNGILFVIIAHTAFHLWRHYIVKDNALRIMVPKALHRYL